MNHVMPVGWDFLTQKYMHKSETLPFPMSPYPTEWYWEAVREYDMDDNQLGPPEGMYSYEFMMDPEELIADLRSCDFTDVRPVPVYRRRVNQELLDKSAGELEVHPEELEMEEGDE